MGGEAVKADEILPANQQSILDAQKADIFSTFHCVQIGKIEKVTAAEQTVEVTLQIKRPAADGTSSAIPLLVDVPYMVLQGGGSYIDLPIAKGDYCIVLFNDRDIDTWWSTANMSDPSSSRKHDLSDGIAIVGLNPKTKPLPMQGATVGIIGGPNKINLENSTGKFDQWMADFIDAIVGIKTFGSPPSHTLTPDTISKFTALKTRAGNLFGGS
jgi:hypothetical protein